MPPIDDAWIEYQRPLPGGGTFTRLRPGSAINEPDQPTVTAGRGRRLIRFGSVTLALNSTESHNFPREE